MAILRKPKKYWEYRVWQQVSNSSRRSTLSCHGAGTAENHHTPECVNSGFRSSKLLREVTSNERGDAPPSKDTVGNKDPVLRLSAFGSINRNADTCSCEPSDQKLQHLAFGDFHAAILVHCGCGLGAILTWGAKSN